MAIPPSVFLLPGFRAAFVVALHSRALALIAQKSEFQIPSLELSFG